MESSNKPSPIIAVVVIIALIGFVTGAVLLTRNSEPETSQTTQPSTSTPVDSSEAVTPSDNSGASAVVGAEYTNGTYSATGSYSTPGGRESVGLTVTIDGGIITKVDLQQNAKSSDSKQFQSRFASGYEELVVGKKISDVSLSRVAGSSLTSSGFNDAIEQIRTDAES